MRPFLATRNTNTRNEATTKAQTHSLVGRPPKCSCVSSIIRLCSSRSAVTSIFENVTQTDSHTCTQIKHAHNAHTRTNRHTNSAETNQHTPCAVVYRLHSCKRRSCSSTPCHTTRSFIVTTLAQSALLRTAPNQKSEIAIEVFRKQLCSSIGLTLFDLCLCAMVGVCVSTSVKPRSARS